VQRDAGGGSAERMRKFKRPVAGGRHWMAVAVAVTDESRTATGNRRYITKRLDLEEFLKVVKSIGSFWLTLVKLLLEGIL
jgi:hypothetical protein